MTEKKFPIAETFTSPQGEGLYAGTLMTFIRFAGCSVGKKMSAEARLRWSEKECQTAIDGPPTSLPLLPEYREICTTYDGREFVCDTNFQTKEVLTVDELMKKIPEGVSHVCITGGEPLDQPLEPLLSALADSQITGVHVETSGTVMITDRAWPKYVEGDSLSDDLGMGWLWITVSPKKNVLPDMVAIANEIKLLVDENFDVDKVPKDILEHELVWIQPINQEFSINEANMKHCLELQKKFPAWRISGQWHKYWNVR